MLNYALSDEIQIFFIDVSEEIQIQNLKKFIITSLKLKNITINKNDFVHINFLIELNQYQILIFPNNKKAIFQIFELYYFDKKDIQGFDLYICDKFFSLYKNGEFYYIQKLESQILIDDLLEYIRKNFSLNVDNFQVIEKDYQQELETLYSQKIIKNRLKNFNKTKEYGFYIYLIYLVMIFYCFIFFYDNLFQNDKNINESISNEYDIEKLKREYLFSSFFKEYKSLFEQINKFYLTLLSFEYKEEKVKIVLSSTEKSNIYSFYTTLNSKLISQDISFVENKNIYEATIYVQLSK